MSVDREHLEQAIATLEAQRAILGDAVVELALAPLRAKLAAGTPPPVAEPQRKQVTVLFADVSGFTAMSETLDAEDVAVTMNALWQRLDSVIVQHHGRIDKHIGDAVMAVWGVAAAREDDPEQALRAALGMQGAIRDFAAEQQVALKMRIGLNTGPVLLGGVGTTGELTVMGDTVNLASRMEHAAPVGGILITHDTYRHVRGLFAVQEPPPIQVKGKSDLVRVYQVLGEKPRAFRLDTRGVEGVETHMVGRAAELQSLQTALDQIGQAGTPRLITIVAEAGMGKSRLVYEFDSWVETRAEPVLYFKGRASEATQTQPYALLRDLFAARFQILDSDPVPVVREKLEHGFGEVWVGPGTTAGLRSQLIGYLLGFAVGDSPLLAGFREDVQQVRDRALVYLQDYLNILSQSQPLVILLEDLHWADESSLEALMHLLPALQNRRLLTVAAARPALFERYADWGRDRFPGVQLRLAPLSARDSRGLVEEILQQVEVLPTRLLELIVAEAEGNPFYIEELIKMLVDDGVIQVGSDRWIVDMDRLAAVRVPPTLTGILQARLEALPVDDQPLIQRAAVIGRVFWSQAVDALADQAEPAVTRERLKALSRRELVVARERSSFAESAEYLFKNLLLHEVTYERVLKRDRRGYHARAARWLDAVAERNGRADEYAVRIAEHYWRAEENAAAAEWYSRAARSAAQRFSNEEALQHVAQALELTPASNAAARYEMHFVREKVNDLLGDRSAQAADLAAMDELAQRLDAEQPLSTVSRRAAVALRRSNYAEATGDYAAAVTAAQEALQWAAGNLGHEMAAYLAWGRALWRQGDAAARGQFALALERARMARMIAGEAESLRGLGGVHFGLGEYPAARANYEAARALYEQIGDQRGEGLVLANLGSVAYTQGDYEAARGHYAASLQVRREIGDRRGESSVLNNLGNVAFSVSDYPAARQFWEQSLQLYRQNGDRWGEGAALSNLGNVAYTQHDYAQAQTAYAESLRLYSAIHAPQGESSALTGLGNVAHIVGDHELAADCYTQALTLYRSLGDRRGESLILWNLGLLAHQLGDQAGAFAHSQEALLLARAIGAQDVEGDALTVLGHALQGQGRLVEAREVYQQALVLRQTLGQWNLATEPQAGLARLALQTGDLAGARQSVEPILAYLTAHDLDGTEEPFRVYLSVIQVLQAVDDPRAREVLGTAHEQLEAWAARFPDERQRQAFLEAVPSHRALQSAWLARTV